MNPTDNFTHWFKELPPEEPSANFKTEVMQRVMAEWSRNPVRYQPIISKKGWWTIALITFGFTIVLLMIHSAMPASISTSNPTTSTFLGLNLSGLINPFTKMFERLNNISPVAGIGVLTIAALWFFDQLFSRTVKH